MALNQVVGVVIMYRTRMLAVTGSQNGNYFLFNFCCLFFYFVSSFRVTCNFGLD